MERNHLVYGEEVNIDWEKSDLIENHGSGCCYYLLIGIGGDGNEYQATGIYQGYELQVIKGIFTFKFQKRFYYLQVIYFHNFTF